MNKKIVISGGGTGGHIYPAIGIANALLSLDSEIDLLFIGSADRLESTLVPQHGFRFLPISVAGFPRRLTWRWIPVIGKVCSGLIQSLFYLKEFSPALVVGTGGYVSGPVLFAASLLGIPIAIQEQNASPGITNRFLGKWAEAVYLALEAAAPHFPAHVVSVTGNPIRSTIAAVERRRETYEKFGLNPGLKTVFVMGGSQGAHAINQAMMDGLSDLASYAQQLQIVHQTGKNDHKAVQACYDESPLPHLVQPYFDPIEEIYSIADLMVCRAGGMTVSEITACGIPALFIPLPTATGNDQLLNALAVADAGGGLVLEQNGLTGNALAGEIIQRITDSASLRQMAESSRQLGKPNASEDIARSIARIIKRNS